MEKPLKTSWEIDESQDLKDIFYPPKKEYEYLEPDFHFDIKYAIYEKDCNSSLCYVDDEMRAQLMVAALNAFDVNEWIRNYLISQGIKSMNKDILERIKRDRQIYGISEEVYKQALENLKDAQEVIKQYEKERNIKSDNEK